MKSLYKANINLNINEYIKYFCNILRDFDRNSILKYEIYIAKGKSKLKKIKIVVFI